MVKCLVQHRRGTTEQWASEDTLIPEEGEIVIEFDDENLLHKLKIGDGIHTYSQLAYLQAGDEIVTQMLSRALPRVITISIDSAADKWEEMTCATGTYYRQPINLGNITSHSRLDLQPDAEMIAELKKLGIVFVTENIKNQNGKNQIVINSIGNKPTTTYTMQATIIETNTAGTLDKITGIPVGVPSTSLKTTHDGNGNVMLIIGG